MKHWNTEHLKSFNSLTNKDSTLITRSFDATQLVDLFEQMTNVAPSWTTIDYILLLNHNSRCIGIEHLSLFNEDINTPSNGIKKILDKVLVLEPFKIVIVSNNSMFKNKEDTENRFDNERIFFARKLYLALKITGVVLVDYVNYDMSDYFWSVEEDGEVLSEIKSLLTT